MLNGQFTCCGGGGDLQFGFGKLDVINSSWAVLNVETEREGHKELWVGTLESRTSLRMGVMDLLGSRSAFCLPQFVLAYIFVCNHYKVSAACSSQAKKPNLWNVLLFWEVECMQQIMNNS